MEVWDIPDANDLSQDETGERCREGFGEAIAVGLRSAIYSNSQRNK